MRHLTDHRLTAPDRSLPRQATPIVGRASDLAQLRSDLLQGDARLVTLTGPGGVGKTRLALEVASSVAAEFEHGAVFVDLAAIQAPDHVPLAIARALGLDEMRSEPVLDRLLWLLGDWHILLVLDNFEHLLNAATVLDQVLQACPAVQLLVTSRAPLRLRWEYVRPVAPLALPPRDITMQGHRSLTDAASVTLLVQRALAVAPNLSLDAPHLEIMAEICHRLAGLPLALELAAARMHSLSPRELLQHLDQPLSVLDHGAVDMPARQQTMRATIEWSYRLLPPMEQQLMRRLAVFTDGCTLETAAAVCGDSPDQQSVILAAITALIEHGLLQREAGANGAYRFLMLEPVRQYAHERLDEAHETETVRRRHLDHMLDVAREAEAHLRGDQRVSHLEQLRSEIANLRQALRWAIDRGDHESGCNLFAPLYWFWTLGGYHAEGYRWAEELKLLPGASSTLGWARVCLAMAELTWDQDHERQPHRHAEVERAVAICRAAGDARWTAAGLRWLIDYEPDVDRRQRLIVECREATARTGDPWEDAQTAMYLGLTAANAEQLGEARALLNSALVTFNILGDEWFAARCRFHLGIIALASSDLDGAESQLRDSVPVLERMHDRRFHTWALDHLGEIALAHGQKDMARSCFEQSAMISRRAGDPARLADSLLVRAIGLLQHGDPGEVERCVLESLGLNLERRRTIGTAYCLYVLAGLLAERQPARAARLVGAGERLLRHGGVDVPQPYRAAQRQTTEAIKHALGADRFAQEWTTGQSMSLTQLTADDAPEISPSRLSGGGASPGRDASVQGPFGTVSEREREVLRLLAAGKSNREIASILCITVNTVFRHVSNIFDKTGATNRTEAAAYAYRHGLAP